MATYRKYTDENGNTIYEEIKKPPKENNLQDIRQRVIQQDINQQYWEELDRRNKATRKVNFNIKLFWIIVMLIGFVIFITGLTVFKNFYPIMIGLLIVFISGNFVRNKYSER